MLSCVSFRHSTELFLHLGFKPRRGGWNNRAVLSWKVDRQMMLELTEAEGTGASHFMDYLMMYLDWKLPTLRRLSISHQWIQVSSYFLWISFKLAASWLFDHLDQIISKLCPPSNKLSRRNAGLDTRHNETVQGSCS
ncbi:hypothetical protein AMECASPLE_011463 [Ameca splendens]|uniref:Uncharacterized protein n=1 Tax=Ameca splendens TaxID=208324 RepID=A0ABV0ZMC4_9TELE